MKVEIALAKGRIGLKSYYLVINDTFYIKIKKKIFYQLAEYLNIKM